MKLALQADAANVTETAYAQVVGPNVKGEATFTEYDVDGAKYVHLRLEVSGDPSVITAGKHAVHIHEKGACDCEGFKCAGGHFDPGPSGNTDPDANHGYHAGDLPSITINEEGHGILEAITTRVTLSPGPVSVLDKTTAPEGTSLMIHANPDPHTPGESGSGHSGGPRMACGTINAEKEPA
jgi:Cu-Zn family superoxide dismutase